MAFICSSEIYPLQVVPGGGMEEFLAHVVIESLAHGGASLNFKHGYGRISFNPKNCESFLSADEHGQSGCQQT